MSIVILGNKTDLEEMREVKQEEIKQIANNHNLQHYEVSAKSGHNIKEAFEYMISCLPILQLTAPGKCASMFVSFKTNLNIIFL